MDSGACHFEDSIHLRERRSPVIRQDVANRSACASRTSITDEHSFNQESAARVELKVIEDEDLDEDDGLLGDLDAPEKGEGIGDKAGVILVSLPNRDTK